MEEAFSHNAQVLGVMRSSLKLAATDQRYRRGLMEGQLTLVSASDPVGRQPDRETDALVRALSKLFMLPIILGRQTDEIAAIAEGISYGGGIGTAFLLAYLIWNERRIRILLRQHDSGRTRPH